MNENEILKIAEEILAIASPSGYTKNVINYLIDKVKDLNYSYHQNNNGSLVVSVKGKKDYVVGLSAHVDTLGAIVRSIQSDGTLRFSQIGGPILPTYDGEYCTIYTREENSDGKAKTYSGTFLSNSPAVHVYQDAQTVARNADTMHIRLDEKVMNKSDVEKLGIANGDFIAVDPKTTIVNGFIKSRFLDDKISAAILVYLLQHLHENNITPEYNLEIIFSVFEEVGFGSSFIPHVDELIAVDMGCIGKDLSCTEYDVSICAKDSSGPYNYDVTTRLINLAKKNNLRYAVDIYPFYSSDVSAALRGGNNIKGGLIGPGVHASHGMERTHIEGITNTFKLVLAYITSLVK